MSATIRPTITLAEVFGPSHVYAPRAHRQTCRWISSDEFLLDWLTGNQLAVVGDVSVICSAGCNTPAAQALLSDAGLEITSTAVAYRNEKLAFELARDVARRGEKLAVQHAYPSGVVPPEALWIEPSLLSYLNNKANLRELVDEPHRPRRGAYRLSDVVARQASLALPIVLKLATDDSTGGGTAVAVCRTGGDLIDALDRFKSGDRSEADPAIVAEECLPIVRNPCLHFAVMRDRQVRYLGYADQDVTAAGKYCGNWFELGSALPDRTVAVARRVVEQAAALGYRGIAGVDLAILPDDRVLVLDLNFRINGSTAAVLLAPAIHRAFGRGVMHLRSFTAAVADDFRCAIAGMASASARQFALPLAAFDPVTAGHPDRSPRFQTLVLGESKNDVLAREAVLAAEGLV
jgi:hypothetical protein